MNHTAGNVAFNAQFETGSGCKWFMAPRETKCSKITQAMILSIEKNGHGEKGKQTRPIRQYMGYRRKKARPIIKLALTLNRQRQ
jgi:hypothetical protein